MNHADTVRPLGAWEFTPPLGACAQCRFEAPYRQGEWQCPSCGSWWYGQDGRSRRLYDRDRTDDQLTAQKQVAILHATRALEARGWRYLVHFGWGNAVALAQEEEL